MLIAFWFLLFLYVGLTVLYFVTPLQKIQIEPWPLLTRSSEEGPSIHTAPPVSFCQFSTDCPSSHVCLNQHCIPKLAGVHACDVATGRWTSHVHQGATFAVCACLQPLLFDQKYFGGNCDVNVGCGLHGHYDFPTHSCRCDPGYVAQGVTCRKMPIIESMTYNPCGENQLKVSDVRPEHGFHPEYVQKLKTSGVKCVQKPCSFDALSGRFLPHATFVSGWGCVCDPSFGLFGVVLESPTAADKKYLSTPGYDACASIFSENLPNPIHVRLVTTFYLDHREPVSVIAFDNLKDHDPSLVASLKGLTHILLGQKLWRYDYTQYYFAHHPTVRARTRKAKVLKYLFFLEQIKEFVYVDDFSPPECQKIPDVMGQEIGSERANIYALLYQNPVCRVYQHDRQADALFWGRVVVNPLHLTFKEYGELYRSNAFVFRYDAREGYRRWTIDLEYEYKMDLYSNMDTNVPFYYASLPRDVGPFHPIGLH